MASKSTLLSYCAPSWARELQAPAFRVSLAMMPTPVHEWALPHPPHGPSLGRHRLLIKRDDLTGATLTGNKVRKLEFLLADAIAQGADTIITCGAVQSNHARATAIAARQLGLDAHLFLRASDAELTSGTPSESGNLLLDILAGASLHFVPRVPFLTGLLPRMHQHAERLREQGRRPYLIPVGGSNRTGLWGYLECWRELQSQGILSTIDEIVLATGSGGTAAGLAVANYLTGSSVQIRAFSVSDHAGYFLQHLQQTLDGLGGPLAGLRASDLLCVQDGFKGEGYGQSTELERSFIRKVSQTTGIMLDPVYTGKAALGLATLLSGGHGNGQRTLFLHTGGLFGMLNQDHPMLK